MERGRKNIKWNLSKWREVEKISNENFEWDLSKWREVGKISNEIFELMGRKHIECLHVTFYCTNIVKKHVFRH